MDNKESYILNFGTSLKGKDTYTIPRADNTLTEDEVFEFMSEIINNSYFGSSLGQPVEVISAVIEQTTYTDLS